MIRGRVWKYGDHINTDLIIPGRYLDDYNPRSLSSHVMEDLDPTFAKSVQPGDVVVAGKNFGCGSSREQAPMALKYAYVGAVIAESFARIFYRNAINVGLPLIVCPEAVRLLKDGEMVTVEFDVGVIKSDNEETCVQFEPLPAFLLEILERGGLVPYLRSRLQE